MADEQKPKIEVIAESRMRIVLTPERIEAIKRAIRALEEEQREHRTVNYPTARDFEIEEAMATLEDMLDGT